MAEELRIRDCGINYGDLYISSTSTKQYYRFQVFYELDEPIRLGNMDKLTRHVGWEFGGSLFVTNEQNRSISWGDVLQRICRYKRSFEVKLHKAMQGDKVLKGTSYGLLTRWEVLDENSFQVKPLWKEADAFVKFEVESSERLEGPEGEMLLHVPMRDGQLLQWRDFDDVLASACKTLPQICRYRILQYAVDRKALNLLFQLFEGRLGDFDKPFSDWTARDVHSKCSHLNMECARQEELFLENEFTGDFLLRASKDNLNILMASCGIGRQTRGALLNTLGLLREEYGDQEPW